MIQNKIVIRYADGRLLKGITNDFFPNKESFHVTPEGAAPGSKPPEIRIEDLKAVFFVKHFDGNPDYDDKKEFDSGKPVQGRKISVVFKDGELLIGTTTGYQPNRPGFFVNPADAQSNIERCFVVTKATSDVKLI
ncbi:MAG: hypothetical protein R6W75_00025 [Smithellaceae bacterium]